MPNISVKNLYTTPITIPGNYYTEAIAVGATVTFDVPDTDEFVGDSDVADMVSDGQIEIIYTTDDVSDRPLATAATANLPAATSVADGTPYWDIDRERVVTQYGDAWVAEPTVTADTTANLAALTPPEKCVAYNTDLDTLVYFTTAGGWVSLSLSNPATVGAGVPAGATGRLAYNTTTEEFTVYDGAAWVSIMVGASGTIAVPAATAAALAGGMYWNTDTNRFSVHDGANWIHHNVVTRDTTVNIAAIVNPIAGNIAWDTTLNRFSIYTGAAWDAETTVGMYDTATATDLHGVVVRDPTGFANNEVGRGALSVYDTAAAGGAAWVPVDFIVPAYANVGAFPVAADVPEGTLAYDQAGAGGDFLHIRTAGPVAWSPVG